MVSIEFQNDKLSRLMEKKNLSVSELYKEILRKGHDISEGTIRNMINGSVNPSSENVAIIADFFGTTIDYFYAFKRNQTSKVS